MFIYGSKGSIDVGPRSSRLGSFTIFDEDRNVVEEVNVPAEGNGFVHQARIVGDCLRAGKLESNTLPLDETLANMRAMDSLRYAWGVRYPGES